MSYGKGTDHAGHHLREDPGDRYILVHWFFFWLGMYLVGVGTAWMIVGLFDIPTTATTTVGAAEEKCSTFSQVREWFGTVADVLGLISFVTAWQLGRSTRGGSSDSGRRL